MNSNILNSKTVTYVAVAGVALLAVYLIGKKLAGAAGDAARAVGTAINPASSENIANRAVSAVGAALTGDQSFSLGSWLYDLTHEAYDPNAPVIRAAEKRTLAAKFLDLVRGTDDKVIH